MTLGGCNSTSVTVDMQQLEKVVSVWKCMTVNSEIPLQAMFVSLALYFHPLITLSGM